MMIWITIFNQKNLTTIEQDGVLRELRILLLHLTPVEQEAA